MHVRIALKLNRNFIYCNGCGSKIDEECGADYKTECLNVFRRNEGFVYIFAVKGR